MMTRVYKNKMDISQKRIQFLVAKFYGWEKLSYKSGPLTGIHPHSLHNTHTGVPFYMSDMNSLADILNDINVHYHFSLTHYATDSIYEASFAKIINGGETPLSHDSWVDHDDEIGKIKITCSFLLTQS